MFPLSPQQEIVWLHHQLATDNSAYHFTLAADIHGQVIPDRFRESLQKVVDWHPGMRLALAGDLSRSPAQHVVGEVTVEVAEHDLRHSPDQERSLAEIVTAHVHTPFDLQRAPLARWALIRLGDDHFQLVHVEHHLIHDGRSTSMFLRDLFAVHAAALKGEDPALEPGDSYEEYVRYCSSEELGEQVEKDLAWWKDELDGAATDATFRELAEDLHTTRTYTGSQHRLRLSADVVTDLRRCAEKYGHTQFTVLLGLFSELLRRHSGMDDLTLGTALANRPPTFDRTVGMLVNSVPVRMNHEAQWSGREHMDATMDKLFAVLDHQAAPIQQIVRAAGAGGTAFDLPLFRVMFSANDSALPDVELPGLEVELIEGINLSASRGFDIDVVVLPGKRAIGGDTADGLTLVWDYSTQAFDADTVELLAQRYERLLHSYLANPESPIRELGMTGPGDDPVVSAPLAVAPASGIMARIKDLANSSPDRPALITSGGTLTYGEMLDLVRQCARDLSSTGLRSGEPIASTLPRGRDSVILLLACLELGLVFAPLPASAPTDYLNAVLARLRTRLVVIDSEHRSHFGSLGVVSATLESIRNTRIDEAAAAHHDLRDAAYVIHTSGSTGTPKSIAVPLSALTDTVDALAQVYELRAEDRVLQFASPSFDVYLEEVLPTLTTGAVLVVPSGEISTAHDIVALLFIRRLTVLNLPTGYLSAAVDELEAAIAGRRHDVRLLVLGGERLSAELAGRLASAFPQALVLNAYGVSESVITSTVHRFDAESSSPEVPIGRALPGVLVVVVSDRGVPQPIGVPGQIAIGGQGGRAWYVGDDELTARRFQHLAAPLDDRCYLTGDIGCWDAQEQLRFLGRRDRQIKLHGHRIELEEIELAAQRALPGNASAVLLVSSATGSRLVGFVESANPGDAEKLRLAIAGMLPRSARPATWITLTELPKSPAGKVDYSALRSYAETVDTTSESGAPTTSTALDAEDTALLDQVVSCCRLTLARQDFGADDDFFAKGGHSLLCAQLVVRIEDVLGWRPPLRLVFEHPRPRQMAAAIAEQARPQTDGSSR